MGHISAAFRPSRRGDFRALIRLRFDIMDSMDGKQAVLAGLLMLCALAAAAEPQVAASTSTRVTRRDVPLSLTFIQERRGDRRLELGYSLRWDFDDVMDAGPAMLRTMGDPASLWREQSWDIRDRTRFVLYGVRVDPWKALFEPVPPAAVGPNTGPAAGAAGGAVQLRRFQLSVWPMIKDINDHIDEDIRRLALRESLRRLPPDARTKTIDDEKELLRDLIWWQREAGVTGLSGAAAGLEYLAPQRKRGAVHDDLAISTAPSRGRRP